MLTRGQYIEICKRCTKNSFDPKKGIICGLTKDIANFEHKCPTYEADETYEEEATTDEFAYTAKELKNKIPPDKYEQLLREQNWFKAIFFGSVAGIASALGWALLTEFTGFLMDYVPASIGLTVSLTIRYAGKGLTYKYSVLGAIIAFLSCLLGNLLAVAVSLSLEYETDVLSIDTSEVLSYYFESIEFSNIMLYVVAVAEGVKFSIRTISPRKINEMNLIKGSQS